MKTLGYYNGNVKPIEELTIPANDRAVYFGDGIYDVTYAANKKIFALDEHIDRFFNGLKALKIKPPKTKTELKDLLNELVKQQESSMQKLYWQVSRATDFRTHNFPTDNKPANLLIMIVEGKMMSKESPKFNVITLEDTRYLHCNLKSLNLLPSIMAAQRAKEADCDEAVLHRNGFVTECSHSNIAIIKNGQIKTAPCSNLILPGVTRQHLINIAKTLNVDVVEQQFSLDELLNCDEAMCTSCHMLFKGIATVNGSAIGGKNPTLLAKLQDAYEQQIIKACGNVIFE